MTTSLYTPLTNIYPGKMVGSEDLNSAFSWAETILADTAYALQRPDGYGLLAVPDLPLHLGLAGNTLELRSLAALMPSGCLTLQHPVQSPPVMMQLPHDLSRPEYIVYILATPKRQAWNTPESRNNSIHPKYRFPTYELYLKDGLVSSEQFPDALSIGRLVLDKGAYKLDGQFQPPCAHLKASTYVWNITLDSKDLWQRMLQSTNNIVKQTTGVPYNAPLGDLNRLASWVWQYLTLQKPVVQYLRDKSQPSDLFLIWAGLARLFSEYVANITQRPGEILYLMDWYSQGRPGYKFDQQEASHTAARFAEMEYEHFACNHNFSTLSGFIHHVAMAWIFLGEASEIKWMVDQNSYKIKN